MPYFKEVERSKYLYFILLVIGFVQPHKVKTLPNVVYASYRVYITLLFVIYATFLICYAYSRITQMNYTLQSAVIADIFDAAVLAFWNCEAILFSLKHSNNGFSLFLQLIEETEDYIFPFNKGCCIELGFGFYFKLVGFNMCFLVLYVCHIFMRAKAGTLDTQSLCFISFKYIQRYAASMMAVAICNYANIIRRQYAEFNNSLENCLLVRVVYGRRSIGGKYILLFQKVTFLCNVRFRTSSSGG